MKTFLLISFTLLVATLGFSQNSKMIQRSWVKSKIENLSNRETSPDTIYTRYTFTKSKLNISFYPGWDTYEQAWSIKGNDLTLGFDTYTIEELTDSSLTFALSGFRRVRFLSEEYCSSLNKNLIQIGDFNGKPLYEANNFITPRYKKKGSFRTVLEKSVKAYSIPNASYFRVTFVVTEDGKIENIQVTHSFLKGFDDDIIKELKKSSGDWRAATFKGKPVQTLMFYDIRYLKSLTPYKSGKIN